jgi:hypothetical protein
LLVLLPSNLVPFLCFGFLSVILWEFSLHLYLFTSRAVSILQRGSAPWHLYVFSPGEMVALWCMYFVLPSMVREMR